MRPSSALSAAATCKAEEPTLMALEATKYLQRIRRYPQGMQLSVLPLLSSFRRSQAPADRLIIRQNADLNAAIKQYCEMGESDREAYMHWSNTTVSSYLSRVLLNAAGERSLPPWAVTEHAYQQLDMSLWHTSFFIALYSRLKTCSLLDHAGLLDAISHIEAAPGITFLTAEGRDATVTAISFSLQSRAVNQIITTPADGAI